MDYEKKYKEALERAKKYKLKEDLIITQDIFPELAESEDEKIRKELIKVVVEHFGETLQRNKYIRWLENQGEHAKFRDSIQIGDKVTRNEDGVLVNLSQLNRVAKKDEKQGEQPKKHDVCDYCDQQGSCVSPCPMKLVEKQDEQKPAFKMMTPEESLGIDSDTYNKIVDDCLWGEQKPADKVEPKFKIGDKVIPKNHQEESLTITKVTDTEYYSGDLLICKIDEQDKWELVEQKPVEWSEEDETCFEEVKQNFRINKDNMTPSLIEQYERFFTKIKSLSPQKQWKPSEVQLECLGYAIEKAEKDWSPLTNNRVYLTLKALEEQLKKLREEDV